jgi:hypothetical protein
VKVVVFAGPTLNAREIREHLDADVRPPAAMGDIYRAARESPDLIALIDGYFDRVPAPWHKEILWALSQGIHVLGAASMGALRAAELARFGMVGVGEVFRAYYSGALSDDDEVAVVHAPREQHFRPLSEAMVNIRATVSHAFLEGVLSADLAERLLRTAKSLYYPERSYAAVLERLEAAGSDADAPRRFRAWLRDGAINQKRADALGLCSVAGMWHKLNPGPARADFALENTDAWEHARRKLDLRVAFDQGHDAAEEGVLGELRVLGQLRPLEQHAVARNLTERFLQEDSAELSKIGASDLAAAHGIEDTHELARWLERQGLSTVSQEAFLRRHGRFARMRHILSQSSGPDLLDGLRADGRYAELSARYEDKARALAKLGEAAAPGLEEREMWAWYTAEVLRSPAVATPEALALRLGYRSVASLREAVNREFLYRSATQSA